MYVIKTDPTIPCLVGHATLMTNSSMCHQKRPYAAHARKMEAREQRVVNTARAVDCCEEVSGAPSSKKSQVPRRARRYSRPEGFAWDQCAMGSAGGSHKSERRRKTHTIFMCLNCHNLRLAERNKWNIMIGEKKISMQIVGLRGEAHGFENMM